MCFEPRHILLAPAKLQWVKQCVVPFCISVTRDAERRFFQLLSVEILTSDVADEIDGGA